jgi:hypothetical protein
MVALHGECCIKDMTLFHKVSKITPFFKLQSNFVMTKSMDPLKSVRYNREHLRSEMIIWD